MGPFHCINNQGDLDNHEGWDGDDGLRLLVQYQVCTIPGIDSFYCFLLTFNCTSLVVV